MSHRVKKGEMVHKRRLMESLTIESLARAIHEDECAAMMKFQKVRTYIDGSKVPTAFDELREIPKSVRREQARLMLERIMR